MHFYFSMLSINQSNIIHLSVPLTVIINVLSVSLSALETLVSEFCYFDTLTFDLTASLLS